MWRNEACLIVSFLQTIFEGVPSSEEIMGTSGTEILREEAEVPDWIETRTAEELAVEILEYKKKQFPEIEMKIEKAEILAQRAIRDETETQRRERIEKEKEELPSLVSHCIDWARTHGLKRLTVADVDAYIMERNLEILKETRRALYAMANVKLKSRK